VGRKEKGRKHVRKKYVGLNCERFVTLMGDLQQIFEALAGTTALPKWNIYTLKTSLGGVGAKPRRI